MSNESTPTTSFSDSALLQQLRIILQSEPANLDAARRLVQAIEPGNFALRARAERLIRFSEEHPVEGRNTEPPSGNWLTWLSAWIPTRWRSLALVAIPAVAAALAYFGGLSPFENNPYAPEAAANPFPLMVPVFEHNERKTHLISCHHGTTAGLKVLPMPPGVGIIDPLEKWDRRGMFHGAWSVPFDKQYFVNGCLLADEKFLYVAADVGDPWPMKSKIKRDEPLNGWKGGAIQLRFATAGVPVKSEHEENTFCHLTIWYNAKDNKAYLCRALGKSAAGSSKVIESTDNSEAEFAARFEASTQGYVMKARISWSLLNLNGWPKDRTLGMCWEVCWSDAGGIDIVGKFTDIFDADAMREFAFSKSDGSGFPGRSAYQDPSTWGKAFFPSTAN